MSVFFNWDWTTSKMILLDSGIGRDIVLFSQSICSGRNWDSPVIWWFELWGVVRWLIGPAKEIKMLRPILRWLQTIIPLLKDV